MADRYSRDHLVVDSQLLDARSTQPVVVVAGKIGSGKSTALNNLYGLDFEARSSPTSVTQNVTERSVSIDGVTVRVIDTPGLGGVSMKTDSVVRQIAREVEGTDYTLLYCLPVKPSDTLTETDKYIIQCLHQCLGTNVWDKCVLLLTFSDVALQREFTADHQANDYIDFLRGHIQAFHRILKQCGANVPRIRGTFDNLMQTESMQDGGYEIMAVPVMKNRNVSGGSFFNIGKSWYDLALSEISKASQRKRRINPSRPPVDKIRKAISTLLQNPMVAVQEIRSNPVKSAVSTVVGAGLLGLYGWYFHGNYGLCIGAFIGAFLGAFLTCFISLVNK